MQTLKLTKKYETYPEYKDSGVEWLGKIPKGWQHKKLKSFFSLSNERVADNPEVTTILSVSGYRGVEIRKNIETFDGQMPSENVDAYRIVRKNQLVVNTMWLNFTGLGVSNYEGYVSPAYRSYNISKEMVPEYVNHLMRSNAYVQKYSSLLYGMRPNSLQVKPYDFEKIEILYPDIKEQEYISKYLDEKMLLVDKTIEKKYQLIENLKERRTSLINNAIINSGGEKGKLKNYIQLNPSKKTVSGTGPEDTVSFVPMEAISELGELELQERKYKDVSSGFTYFSDGDVVLAKITPCYENGKAGVMKGLKNGFGFGTTEFMVMRPSNKILADYLYYIVFSDKFRKMGEVEMRGTAGQKRVTSSFVMNYELSIPSIKTQEKIVDELNKKMKMFDIAITKVENSILYLKEFKTSLISNVVTGKIKV